MVKKEKLEITIRVDTNDGDYVTGINKISQEDLDTLMPLIKAIKKIDCGHNYPHGECCDEKAEDIYDFDDEVFELFEDYLPSTEHGFHTIERIEVCPLVKKKRLL